jgi:hypothetical protein
VQLDSNGNLLVNVAVGGGGGGANASVGATGATAPTSATEVGTIDSNGKLQGVSAANPLPISGNITASNPSVGTTNVAAPASATEIGVVDGTGKLQGASVSNPVRTDPTGTTTQPISGTVTANAGTNLNTSALALDATLTGGSQKTKIVDSAGTNLATVSAAGALKVDGSAATQPVSGTVSLSAATAVELLDSAGTNKASISAAGAVKVDGSAVIQPISGAVTANAGTNLNTSALALDVTLTGGTQKTKLLDSAGTNLATISAAGAVKVDGSALTQPVSGTFFQATQPVSGTVTANQGTANATPWNENIAQVGGTAAAATAKGTQAANGIGVQDLKDSGRVIKVFSASFTAATTEALVTLTPITDGTAGSTGTSFAITAGKRFRIQALLIATKNAGAAIQGVICNLRMSASGAVTATSPLIATVGAGTISATANNVSAESAAIPDGLELSGTMQFGISQVGTATAGNVVTLIGYEY